jgi:hypothetical protein
MIENRIPIYQDELNERSESKKNKSVRSAFALTLTPFFCGVTSPGEPLMLPFSFWISTPGRDAVQSRIVSLINYLI